MKINELASLEKIQQVAKEQGLTYNNKTYLVYVLWRKGVSLNLADNPQQAIECLSEAQTIAVDLDCLLYTSELPSDESCPTPQSSPTQNKGST